VARQVALRREVPALQSREWELLEVAPADRVLAYRRMAPAGEAVVAVNLSDGEVEIDLPAPAGAIDLLGGEPAAGGAATLPAWGYRILGTVAS
jgi:hypothetical protein